MLNINPSHSNFGCTADLAAVGVEHHESHGELEDDAANRPHVALLVPAWRQQGGGCIVLLTVITVDGYLFCLTELHDDLGCAVVSGLHDGGVVLVVEGGAAEVNQPDLRVLQDSDLAQPPALLPVLRRGVVFVRVAVVKQDVLRLQVRVRQPDIFLGQTIKYFCFYPTHR